VIDTPPDEALEARLYAIDVKIAEVRALLIELKALGAGDFRGNMPQMVIDGYVEIIEATIREAMLAQDILLAPRSPRPV
jgi:hypothetical protein